LIAIVLLSSCQATSFLKKDETYLRKNRIKIDSPEKIDNKIFLKEELYTLYAQKPNESFLWVPKQWFYYVTKDKKGWFNRGIKNNMGEVPSIYEKEKSLITAKRFENHLKNNKGFYNATVNFNEYKEKYITDIDYIIKTGKRYRINSVKLDCEDKSIYNIINKTFSESYLKKGNPINSQDYNSEKIRITNILQNEGYATFNQNYIELKGDSSDYKVDYTLKIHRVKDEFDHKKYKIGKVDIYTDYYPTQKSDSLKIFKIDNLNFYRELDKFVIKPELLADIITFKEGQLYQKKKNREIYNKLSKFQIYRFVSIKSEIDSSKTDKINYRILLNINSDKYYHEENLNINYVTLSADRYFIEFETNGLFLNRNLSSRGDNLSMSASGDIKLNIQTGKYNELNFNSKIDYNNPISPKTIEITPLYLYKRLFNKKTYKEIKNHTYTKARLSYHNKKTIDFLLYSSFNLTYGYSYRPNSNFTIISNQFGVNFVTPTVLDSSKFSNFQLKSMKDIFITGLFLRNFAINYISKPNHSLFSYKLLFGFEMSGAEIYLINKLYNSFVETDEIWKASKDIQFSKYFKAHIDFSPTMRIRDNSNLAFRIFAGAGIPYGDSEYMPYTKQFEVGGPNSMRGWSTRELGPGSYKHNNANDKTDIFYQKGDIRLESNLEYRIKLTEMFRTAFFVDAGNVWTLKYDQEKLGSQFSKDFYKQIAVDYGFSMQIFAKILFRLDVVYKKRNPYPDQLGEYWIKKINHFKPSAVVFAIDHPF